MEIVLLPVDHGDLTALYLLPTGSEESGVLWIGSIPGAILSSCQDMTIIALQLHEYTCSWVVKNKKHLRDSTQAIIHPLAITDRGPMGLGQYNSLGEYYGPHTASSVFLISFILTTPLIL